MNFGREEPFSMQNVGLRSLRGALTAAAWIQFPAFGRHAGREVSLLQTNTR